MVNGVNHASLIELQLLIAGPVHRVVSTWSAAVRPDDFGRRRSSRCGTRQRGGCVRALRRGCARGGSEARQSCVCTCGRQRRYCGGLGWIFRKTITFIEVTHLRVAIIVADAISKPARARTLAAGCRGWGRRRLTAVATIVVARRSVAGGVAYPIAERNCAPTGQVLGIPCATAIITNVNAVPVVETALGIVADFVAKTITQHEALAGSCAQDCACC
mmetsp:Transcript_20108/g.46872  ORF Transcript_20108/g.46872 Transcript_20108/m.46872 type:complete len:217 (+) Transcript_20108:727-1377(+)